MAIDKKDLKIEYTKGKGPGGQRKNKVLTAVRLTHIPSGQVVFIDGRSRSQNKRKALKILEQQLAELQNQRLAEERKRHRDYKIHNTKVVRTYNFKRQTVKDHRTGKQAPLQRVLDGGLDLIIEGLHDARPND